MDAVATREQEKTSPAVSVRLHPVEQSDQPIMANCSTVSVAQGIAYLDFGFIEPALLANKFLVGRGDKPSISRHESELRQDMWGWDSEPEAGA